MDFEHQPWTWQHLQCAVLKHQLTSKVTILWLLDKYPVKYFLWVFLLHMQQQKISPKLIPKYIHIYWYVFNLGLGYTLNTTKPLKRDEQCHLFEVNSIKKANKFEMLYFTYFIVLKCFCVLGGKRHKRDIILNVRLVHMVTFTYTTTYVIIKCRHR